MPKIITPEDKREIYKEYQEGLENRMNKGFLRNSIAEKYNISDTAVCKIHQIEKLKLKIEDLKLRIKELEEENRKLAANQRKECVR